MRTTATAFGMTLAAALAAVLWAAPAAIGQTASPAGSADAGATPAASTALGAGVHRQIRQGDQLLDVIVPKAYDTEKSRRFPLLVFTNRLPVNSIDTLREWADTHGVLVVLPHRSDEPAGGTPATDVPTSSDPVDADGASPEDPSADQSPEPAVGDGGEGSAAEPPSAGPVGEPAPGAGPAAPQDGPRGGRDNGTGGPTGAGAGGAAGVAVANIGGAIAAVTSRCRVHPALRVVVGTEAAWTYVTRRPNETSGLLILNRPGDLILPARHIAVAFVVPPGQLQLADPGGVTTDPTGERPGGGTQPGAGGGRNQAGGASRTLIAANIQRLTENGNPVRSESAAAGNTLGTQLTLAAWLVDVGSLTHPALSREERTAAADRLRERLKAVEAMEDAADRFAATQAMLALPGIDRSDVATNLVGVWFAAGVSVALAEKNPMRQYSLLTDLLADTRSQRAKASDRKVAQTELAKLRKNPAVAQEITAAGMLQKAQAAEKAANNVKMKLEEVASAYEQIFETYPDTPSGAKAQEAAERIRAQLLRREFGPRRRW